MAKRVLGYTPAKAARIKRAVRAFETQTLSRTGSPTGDNTDTVRQWVELLDEGTGDDAGWYSYKVVVFDGTGWVDYPPDNSADSGGEFWARDANGATGLVDVDTIRVEIQFAGWRDDDTPAVIFSYAGAGGSAAKRFKVTGAGLTTCDAKEWDGTTLGDDVVTIYTTQGHGVDDILLAVKSQNGTEGGTDWQEVLHIIPSTDRRKVVQVIDTVGRLGLDWVQAHG
jgi:hypothetical protein